MGIKVLSCFDGMCCGMLAFLESGIEVDSYDAYEIDKYSIAVATHNFPTIVEHGDVFKSNFNVYKGVDFLIGGSPCTYWSIAQTKNRETVASGMGWELFSQYVRALHEAEPRYFIYENNKSMSKDIRRSIDEAFGFEAVLINSALVSAQNRQRLYWVGRRNEDGTYSKVDVEQPTDRGILLKDVLDSAVAMREKNHAVIGSIGRTTYREYFRKDQGEMAAEPINVTAEDKAHTLKAQYFKNGAGNFISNGGFDATAIAEPICIDNAADFRDTPNYFQYDLNGTGHGSSDQRVQHPNGKSGTLDTRGDKMKVFNSVQVGAMPRPNGELSTSQGFRIYDENGKGVALKGNAGGAGGKTGLYVIPYTIEYDEDGDPIKVVTANGKTVTVYEVEDGKITIRGRQYPIKLADGFYIIRKLTVSECKRLQTVPEWYDFSVISDSRAYACLGNGWTISIISHIINSCLPLESAKSDINT